MKVDKAKIIEAYTELAAAQREFNGLVEDFRPFLEDFASVENKEVHYAEITEATDEGIRFIAHGYNYDDIKFEVPMFVSFENLENIDAYIKKLEEEKLEKENQRTLEKINKRVKLEKQQLEELKKKYPEVT